MKLSVLKESANREIYLLCFYPEAPSADETFAASEAYSSDKKRADRIRELFSEALEAVYDDNPKRKEELQNASSLKLIDFLTSQKMDEYHDQMGEMFPQNITLGEIEIDVPGEFLDGPP